MYFRSVPDLGNGHTSWLTFFPDFLLPRSLLLMLLPLPRLLFGHCRFRSLLNELH